MLLTLMLLISDVPKLPTIDTSNYSYNMSRFANAGKVVSDQALNAFNIVQKTSFKPEDIALKGLQTDHLKREAVKAATVKADVAKSASNADLADLSIKNKFYADTLDGMRRKRKAGSIAGLGKIAGEIFMKPKKVELPEFVTTDRTADIESAKKTLDEATKKQAEFIAKNITPPSSDSPASTSNTANMSGGAGTGWGRLSRAIRYAEGTLGDAGYNTMFGGGTFSDMSMHPDTVISANGYHSAAAGAYQFMPATWGRAKDALGLEDFSPESQELAGRYLTQQRNVNPDTIYTNKEDFATAIDALSREWAGLPTIATGTSFYGQGGKSLDSLWSIYNQ